MAVNKLNKTTGIAIPRSKIANETTELLLEYGNKFLFYHPIRAILFASLNGKRNSRAIMLNPFIAAPCSTTPG